MKINLDNKKKNLLRLGIVFVFVIFGVLGTIYCDIRAKDYHGIKLMNVTINVPREYYSEPTYHSDGVFIIDNKECEIEDPGDLTGITVGEDAFVDCPWSESPNNPHSANYVDPEDESEE